MKILGVDNVLVGAGALARAKEFHGGVPGLAEKLSMGETALCAIVGLTDHVMQPHLSRLAAGRC